MTATVYSTQITPRVEYIFSTLLAALGINDVHLTSDLTIYNKADAFLFNYSDQPISTNEIWIKPAGLLFDKNIQSQEIKCIKWSGTSSHPLLQDKIYCFYEVDDGDLIFDIFSASFFLLTRYEEYLPHIKDQYGRYAHENSIAFQNDFLNIPLVNICLIELKKIIEKKFPTVKFDEPAFKFIPTYDIDIAWSFLHKGFKRNAGGLAKDILQGNWRLAKERLDVLFRKKNDPFDSYEWLHALHAANNLHPIYFFLLAQKNKEYDKNILPGKQALQNLIKQHANKYNVGIHPSFHSGVNDKILKNEISLLCKIAGKTISKSRQHYIQMTLPDTYRILLATGITDDYSMGYGSINGFRASYCLPYQWYDLQREENTSLTIHPFCFMDANSFYEQHYTAAQALDEMNHYKNVVNQVSGELVFIWHNHFLGTDKMFAGWKEAYAAFITANK